MNKPRFGAVFLSFHRAGFQNKAKETKMVAGNEFGSILYLIKSLNQNEAFDEAFG
jgi:hypothetical protein